MKRSVLLLLGILLATTLAPTADANTPIDEIRIRNLNGYQGRTLDVFYVSAREPAISVPGQALKVFSIKMNPVRVDIRGNGEASIPPVVVPRTGFDVFNYIVFTLSPPDQSESFLRNPDGTYPEDPRVRDGNWARIHEAAFSHERIWTISLIKYRSLKNAQGGGPSVTIDALRDF